MAAERVVGDPGRARVRRATSALRHLFGRRPAALLTDIDGTISRLTHHAMAASVTPVARRALTRLACELDLVAAVTGRGVSHARQFVGVSQMAYVGNHGLEWGRPDGAVETHETAVAARPVFDAAVAAIHAQVPDPGVLVEDKGPSVSVHYRMCARPLEVQEKLHAVLAPFVQAGELRLIQGGFVINLLPPGGTGKAGAVELLVRQHGLRSVAFFGDDVTDIDGFRAVRALRTAGEIDGLAIGVTGAETPAGLRDEADLLLDGVSEVERVLTALAARPPAR